MNRPWHHICLRDWGHMDPTEYADEITGLRREIRRLTAEADDARPSQRVEAIRRRDHADDKLAWAIASGGAVVLRRTGECTCSDEQATECVIWLPHTREDDKVVDAAMIKIRDDRGKVRHCPLRPGLRADPYVLDFTG